MEHFEIDAKKRIIEAASYLFGMKGYDGTSTREIAARAGVNIAALNYYFKSKNNLLIEVMDNLVQGFKSKIVNIAKDENLSTSEFAVKVFESLTEDNSNILNQFKLVMDSTHFPEEKFGTDPIGFEQISLYLQKEVNEEVPKTEKLWACQVIFSYVNHLALMSVCKTGKKFLSKYCPHSSAKNYIKKVVRALVNDLNNRYK